MKSRFLLWLVPAVFLLPSLVMAIAPPEESKGQEPQKRTLRFISDLTSPPFAFVENFKNVGFEIDLGEALGKELGAEVKWIKQIFNIPTFASTLRTGGADAVLSSMTVTKDRKQYFDFTIPYFRTSLAVAAPRDVDWDRVAFRNGLSSKVLIGVMRRTTSEEWARKNLKATRKTYSSSERLARALKNREVAIILIDEPILRWTMANRHYKFKIVESELAHQDYAIAVNKGNRELLAELNAALKKLDADGVYDAIYEKWYAISRDLPELGK